MEKTAKIYVAGHKGLVGSALMRRLKKGGYSNLVYRDSEKLDLRSQSAVEVFFHREKPEYVFLAAARVGGIQANKLYPARFIYDNLMIQTNVIHAAYRAGVKKLLFLGSTCIYPRNAPQPIKEEYLLDGKLESTNEAYAVAKIAGIKMCLYYNKEYGTEFISVMPTNLYGPGDNFDPETAHVLPALISKFYYAREKGEKEVVIWGSGTPRREFLHVDDLADAVVYLIKHYSDSEPVNIGVGRDISIDELAHLIQDITGYKGEIVYDRSKPDGTPRKLLDITKLTCLGWRAGIGLREGIEMTCRWFGEKREEGSRRA